MRISRVQSHGPSQKYHRVCIPPEISVEIGIEKSDMVSWDILDDNTVILKRLKV